MRAFGYGHQVETQHRVHTGMVVFRVVTQHRVHTGMVWSSGQDSAQGSHCHDICEHETGVQGMEMERGIKKNLEKQE